MIKTIQTNKKKASTYKITNIIFGSYLMKNFLISEIVFLKAYKRKNYWEEEGLHLFGLVKIIEPKKYLH